MQLSITDLKKGTLIEWDGQPFKVVDYRQKVMGRGGSIVNVRIKSLIDAKVLDKTFKGNDQLTAAEVVSRKVQYLYNDTLKYFFMDELTYEQFELNAESLDENYKFIKEGDYVDLQFFKGQAINIQLPKNVALKVSYCEDAVKGDTSTAVTKNATLETGLTLKVPSFIKQGDVLSIDTSTGQYRERIKGA